MASTEDADIQKREHAPKWLMVIMEYNDAWFYHSVGQEFSVHMPDGQKRVVPREMRERIMSKVGNGSVIINSDCILESPMKPRREGRRASRKRLAPKSDGI